LRTEKAISKERAEEQISLLNRRPNRKAAAGIDYPGRLGLEGQALIHRDECVLL
jgi:hypothetical protein